MRKGEIVGLAGLIGAGRTEVARAIFGLDPIDAGEVLLGGTRAIRIATPSDAIGHGIAMVSEDRKAEGLVLCRSVGENISLANLDEVRSRPFYQGTCRDGRRRQDDQVASDQDAERRDDLPRTSAAATSRRSLSRNGCSVTIKLLILDEPTRGIDVGSKSEIHKLMVQLARQGLAIIMISSELPEVLGMSDRIVVMQEGSVRGELNRSEANQENVMRLATGGHA